MRSDYDADTMTGTSETCSLPNLIASNINTKSEQIYLICIRYEKRSIQNENHNFDIIDYSDILFQMLSGE